MDRFDRIFLLNNILQTGRYPVSHKKLQERLECSRATVTRTIEDLRDYLNAPIEYDRKANGYFYNQSANEMFELPGLWFNASELQALLGMQQLLDSVQPGLLDRVLTPLRQRIDQLLQHKHGGSHGLTERIRILQIAARPAGEYFSTVAAATAGHQRLKIGYQSPANDSRSERVISPQRLTYYRNTWYLDAWCHLRDALRTFALDAIVSARSLDEPVIEVDAQEMEQHFAASYGIFSGQAIDTALLRFSPQRARWVAREQWHPQQQGAFVADGYYELQIPYSDSRELIMDILRHGPDVEVLEPKSLREAVYAALCATTKLYAK